MTAVALLIGKVLVLWVFVSAGGGLLLLGVLELRWWLHSRRGPSNVVPLPDRSNVRVVTRQDLGA